MEDRSGKMARNNKLIGKKSRPDKSKSWTLLLIGDLGKVASFKVSRFLLVGFLATVVFLLVYAGVMTLGYYRMHSLKTDLEGRLAETQAKLLAVKEDRDAAQVRLMLLGKGDPEAAKEAGEVTRKESATEGKKRQTVASKASQPRKEKNVSEEKAAVTEDKSVKTPEPASATQAPEAPEAEADSEAAVVSEDTASSSVLVTNFRIWPTNDDTSVRYKFKLENISPKDITISGYTFVALVPGPGSDEPIRIAPWSPMEDGEPSLIKRGQYFGISRFKYVRGTLPDIRDATRFENVTVYVYSDTGKLLHKKAHPVDAALRSGNEG